MQIANYSLLLLLPSTSFNKTALSYQKILISCRIISIFLNPTYKPEGATCWFNLTKMKTKRFSRSKSRERPETLSPRNDLQNAILSACGQSPLQTALDQSERQRAQAQNIPWRPPEGVHEKFQSWQYNRLPPCPLQMCAQNVLVYGTALNWFLVMTHYRTKRLWPRENRRKSDSKFTRVSAVRKRKNWIGKASSTAEGGSIHAFNRTERSARTS